MSEQNGVVLTEGTSENGGVAVAEAPAPKAKPKSNRAKSPEALKKRLDAAKAADKKASKPKVKAKKKAAGKTDRSAADVPAGDRRVALVKLLRKLGASSATAARPVPLLAEKLGYNQYDVYCLGYHKFPLAVGGFLKSVKHEGQKTVSFYLTAKGMKAEDDEIR